jgi:hypothetical protein
MTAKQDPYEIDAYNAILHAMQLGVSIDNYLNRVKDVASKKIRKSLITKRILAET